MLGGARGAFEQRAPRCAVGQVQPMRGTAAAISGSGLQMQLPNLMGEHWHGLEGLNQPCITLRSCGIARRGRWPQQPVAPPLPPAAAAACSCSPPARLPSPIAAVQGQGHEPGRLRPPRDRDGGGGDARPDGLPRRVWSQAALQGCARLAAAQHMPLPCQPACLHHLHLFYPSMSWGQMKRCTGPLPS